MMGNLVQTRFDKIWDFHRLFETLVLNPSRQDFRINKNIFTSDLYKNKITIRQCCKKYQDSSKQQRICKVTTK